MNFTHPGMQTGRQLSTNTQQIHLQNINTPGIAASPPQSNSIPQQLLNIVNEPTLKMNDDKTGAQMGTTPQTAQTLNPQQAQPQLQQSQNHSNGEKTEKISPKKDYMVSKSNLSVKKKKNHLRF